jgi:phosphoribosylaminoimidazolecarboxamide formyltransferase / IMP cyclohydrolase
MLNEAGKNLKIRRALLSVSDKAGIVELARALSDAGAELVATGKTARVLEDAGLRITPIERVSGSPEAFQGRMKTLSFPVCSGILYRRGDASDEADLARLGVEPIDCVVVNFYPFEQAAARAGISQKELIEEVDIGGPTLVRAAAKNSPSVLVLTDPTQYSAVISDLRATRAVSIPVVEKCAARTWERVLAYDRAIAERLGEGGGEGVGPGRRALRYGENPHQTGHLEFDPSGPIDWATQLTPTELSYNNILDLTAAYHLVSDLIEIDPASSSVVIIKHGNPCGVAMIPKASKTGSSSQLTALQKAWDGDPVSAFGGVLAFSDPLEDSTAAWLAERFIELVAAPGLSEGNAPSRPLGTMLAKRKNLKAVGIRRYGEVPRETVVAVPGGKLFQTSDTGNRETLKSVTKHAWPAERERLSRFGIAVCRTLKSNAIALVREVPGVPGSAQLAGAGQGQPNRIDSLKILAVPRALAMGAELGTCLMVSDAFFPFRDTVDTAFEAGIRNIIQPGGSMKDAESISACDQHGIAMAFTGVRHFKH